MSALLRGNLVRIWMIRNRALVVLANYRNYVSSWPKKKNGENKHTAELTYLCTWLESNYMDSNSTKPTFLLEFSVYLIHINNWTVN